MRRRQSGLGDCCGTFAAVGSSRIANAQDSMSVAEISGLKIRWSWTNEMSLRLEVMTGLQVARVTFPGQAADLKSAGHRHVVVQASRSRGFQLMRTLHLRGCCVGFA